MLIYINFAPGKGNTIRRLLNLEHQSIYSYCIISIYRALFMNNRKIRSRSASPKPTKALPLSAASTEKRLFIAAL